LPSLTGNTISDLKDQVGTLKEMSSLGFMLGIFENNVIKCFLALILGIAVGLAPLAFTIANGFVVGVAVGYVTGQSGLLYVLVGMVPHGVIEMPMVFLSGAIGLKLGWDVLRSLYRAIRDATGTKPGSDVNRSPARKQINLWKDVKEGLLIYVFWVAPLLLVAAFLETFVTGTLLYLLFAH
jgi:stage II sporulation protein M